MTARNLGPYAIGAALLLAVACQPDGQVESPPIADVSDILPVEDTFVPAEDQEQANVDAGCINALSCPQSDDPCLSFVCHLELDCVEIVLPDGAICDDQDACTGIATCVAGKC